MPNEFKCFCGNGFTSESGDVGKNKKNSGFTPIFTYEGIICWTCPDCIEKIKESMKVIASLTNNYRFLYYGSLLNLVTKE